MTSTVTGPPSIGVAAYPVQAVDVDNPSLSWVRNMVEQFPEVSWLLNDRDTTSKPAGQKHGSFSFQLWRTQSIAVDCLLMSLQCFWLILEGTHESHGRFIEDQPEDVKLSWESFCELNTEMEYLTDHHPSLSDREMGLTMQVALVLGAIGKSEIARKAFGQHGISHPDHDLFFGCVMDFLHEHPQVLKSDPSLLPSFARLPKAARKLIYHSTKIGHQGHMAIDNLFALRFGRFIHKCVVAGALGHKNNHSSLSYTEETHRAKKGIDAAMCLLKNQKRNDVISNFSHLEATAVRV